MSQERSTTRGHQPTANPAPVVDVLSRFLCARKGNSILVIDMSRERSTTRCRQPAANPAPVADVLPQRGNIVLTPEQFERLINIVQAANSQASAAAGNQPVTQAPIVQAPSALSPALVNMATPIDFTTSEGNKLNKASIAALSYKFDVESQSINTFNEIFNLSLE